MDRSNTRRAVAAAPGLVSRRSVLVGGSAVAGILLVAPTAAAAAATVGGITVAAGQTLVIAQTTRTNKVSIAAGGTLAAPSGYSLTMTVDGVDTGELLTATGGAVTSIAACTYRGEIVLTVAAANDVSWSGLVYPFRQALYVDATGVVAASSVLAGVVGGRLTGTGAGGVAIASTGEAYNGVYVNDGSFTLVNPRISLTGNGRCDFVGYGAAVVGTGTSARLVVDGAEIRNHGAVRTGVVSDNGATVVVKNSTIHTESGVLPADYQPTVDLEYMESVPWMLSISGNVRATNVLGQSSVAGYVNSRVSSSGWGVLSSDSGQDCQLTAINCEIAITGPDGYGSYAIGNATERFLGTRFDVGTYATINRGGAVYYGDSTPAAVAAVNTELGLGLTARELAALPARPSVVNSRRFGFMWHGAGSLDVSGGTVVNTREAVFLDKGQQVEITVDGSRGARLNPANGILLQVMENDDPGPVMVDGKLVNAGVYTEPTGVPAKYAAFDVTAVHDTDAVATFTAIDLKGDFYNGMRGGSAQNPGLNLALTFVRAQVQGVISATATTHHVSTITSAQYEELGEVTNTLQAVINNGVIVQLDSGSQWTVTGTSYLSKLVVAADADVRAAGHRTVSMTVDGTATAITPGGTYTGAIVVSIG